jgi:hypothetical protein
VFQVHGAGWETAREHGTVVRDMVSAAPSRRTT